VVCAKTLAWAAGAAIVAVDTYLAIAEAAPADVAALQVVGDGQRGDLYVGRFARAANGQWQRTGAIEIRSAADWLAGLAVEDVVTGAGLERHTAAAARICRVLPTSLWAPAAKTVALLGGRRAGTGHTDDVWSLEPFYLRRSGAEETADAAGT
jgi:tRNA threonylcarbamoyladenosine biosynthesis protein TsaB